MWGGSAACAGLVVVVACPLTAGSALPQLWRWVASIRHSCAKVVVGGGCVVTRDQAPESYVWPKEGNKPKKQKLKKHKFC